ncbi:adenylate/guanylate cyclase domain-containing protein [Fulvivirga sedimenti]|uniref:Adenylate/guanylate cyclase domain-containing protein n=1 Tax=Fulvivirga sedimenti TaxID=2879465 RepID=A0A9X1HV72_9BACT|nr:adenylate/guanylate cyclase domain-containing protein [Fulvivirga sedimenti]MCA6075664.1 adenylate/guanylate cyclase domain-containing protein [Fulvivirga sedimenti]MCA6076792.1 adenylate/guanylate cyclase domain-containing protein [Fulvivirga sedimenti]
MKSPNNRLKFQLQQVLLITLFWMIISAFEFLIQYSVIIFLDLNFSSEMAVPYLLINIVVGMVAGLIGGSILVFVWNRWLRSISYGRALVSIFITFSLIYLCVYLIINAISIQFSIFPPAPDLTVTRHAWPILIQYVNWLVIGLGTLFFLQVNDKYGPGVLSKFLMGKYFHPRPEERIFMFLDLKSSTTIAEKLGNEQYFQFLKDAFTAITPSILKHNGEIYQYVGDEIVVSWNMNHPKSFQRAILCFFDISDSISGDENFKKRYQVQPEFKAGIHGGIVIAGEMGIIKREIAYSGDVLNTTSRIQESCKQFDAHLLISNYIYEKVKHLDSVRFEQIGSIPLRGKNKPLELFKVEVPEY